ncbi:MAG: hypothetical protein AAGD22_16995 [Verrucomicrobiota bacterium]
MAQLKRSERILLTVFGVALFLVVNFFLYLKASSFLESAQGEYDAVELLKLESDSLMAEKSLWDERAAWLNQNQPYFENGNVAETALLGALNQLAAENSLTVDDQDIGDRNVTPHYEQVEVVFNLTGSLENILRWLHAVQQPGRFRAVTFCELKPEKSDASIVKCGVTVRLNYLTAELEGQG